MYIYIHIVLGVRVCVGVCWCPVLSIADFLMSYLCFIDDKAVTIIYVTYIMYM